ncbi:3-hydroxyacyl-CoA dehydrogenase NAD-binding domain-containing protein [Aliikangiella sp. IMCC44359]|uniref:3-hydroxyacyl-CoA dehydrogenase NAD-binding domain-containing protein n=1 Tax=Aliikangiella sp. IMCC44359 TaxID=3459125 RepID=UPI00403ADAAF
MTSNQVMIEKQNPIGIISIDYPPVNALSQIVRQGLVDGIDELENDDNIKVIIIACANKTFIAGADIKEFGLPPTEPFLPDVVNRIEASTKPVIASLFGTSLGGGFEVALACHYRVALENAKVGLPEVNLGLIPGAGGTQRLPRVVGAKKALEMITGGKHYSVNQLSSYNLIDSIFPKDANLKEETIAFANKLLEQNKVVLKRVGENTVDDEGVNWQESINQIEKKSRGKQAPVVAANVLYETRHMDIQEGMAVERKAFLDLRESEQSAALRFAFGAEKKAAKTDLKTEPLSVKQVGIIGGGNMGAGIATAFLFSGYNLCLVERNAEALESGKARIEKNLQASVKRGLMSETQYRDCISRMKTSINYDDLADSDLIIEAVFEDIQIKKDLFLSLDKIVRADCVLATNTSYLDINEIATVLSRPQQLIGMHFFSPANIMKLLEVVQAEKSSEQALATAMAVGKKLKKVSVLVGVCFGFAGNRMYTRYGREIQQMLLEGAGIEQIDQAMTQWGMAMGPLAVQDLSGIDIGHNARSAQPFPEHDPGYFRAAAVMVENGRLGRKTGKGFYSYDDKGGMNVDLEAAELIKQKANSLGIQQRSFTNDEIVERALLALISEGLSLMAEGIVQRLSDIDVIWLHGYGFPRHKGGPMYYARQLGEAKVKTLIEQQQLSSGERIWPHVDTNALSR